MCEVEEIEPTHRARRTKLSMSNLHKFCAKTMLPEVVPVLLRLLNRQEEDADKDGWNIHIHVCRHMPQLYGPDHR